MSAWQDRVTILQDDITCQDTDAIVNAANEQLARGSGVCGAIHAAAGPDLAAACDKIGGCPTGQAVITEAYDLRCRKVIHAVGPVWSGGAGDTEAELLASCYRESLHLAAREGLTSIAFPSISTGIYGYPVDLASRVALRTIAATLAELPAIEEVRLVCFSAGDLSTYEEAWRELTRNGG